MSTLINRRLLKIKRKSDRMEVKAPNADCIPFQTVIYVGLHLPSQGLVEKKGGYKNKDQDQQN